MLFIEWYVIRTMIGDAVECDYLFLLISLNTIRHMTNRSGRWSNRTVLGYWQAKQVLSRRRWHLITLRIYLAIICVFKWTIWAVHLKRSAVRSHHVKSLTWLKRRHSYFFSVSVLNYVLQNEWSASYDLAFALSKDKLMTRLWLIDNLITKKSERTTT